MAPARTPLVGRRADLARLRDAAGLGTGGAGGHGVLVAGEAGVGKTRLLDELAAEAAAAGRTVLTGHCVDFGDGAPPYLPFTEVLGQLARERPALAASVAAEVPVVGRLMPGRRLLGAPEEAGTPRLDRAELFTGVRTALAAAGPLLVLAEDLHWADRSTRELLGWLLAQPAPGGVVLVGSYRSDELGRRHPLRAALAEWARLPGVEQITLGPLPDADARRLLRSLHPGPLWEAEVASMVARAGGNAFFLEQLADAAAGPAAPLPAGLADLLLVRLERLDEPVRQVLRAVAVAGGRVSHGLLAAVVGLGAPELERALREAVDARVLVGLGDWGYAFHHALLSEAVYEDLLPGERARLHAAFADELSSGATGTAADLARHARASHDAQRALRASIQAGEEALAVAGPDEAAHHFEHALELLGELGEAAAGDAAAGVDAQDLVLRTAEALVAAGHAFRAASLLEDRLAHLPAGTTPAQRAVLRATLAEVVLPLDTLVDPLALTTEALHDLNPGTPDGAWALAVHARAAASARRREQARRAAEEAAAEGRRLGLDDVVAEATTTLARLDHDVADAAVALAASEAAVRAARAAGDTAAHKRALLNLGTLHLDAGRLGPAAEAFAAGTELARREGRPWAPYALEARVHLALVAYATGDWDEVARLVDVAGEAPPELAEALLGAVKAVLAAGRGDPEGVAVLAAVRPMWSRDGLVALTAAGAAIDLHGDRGRLAEAVAAHDDAVAIVGELWHEPLFEGRLRLAGLLAGQLCAEAARRGEEEGASLLGRADDLAGATASVAAARGHLGPESASWSTRLAAEHLRLRWVTGLRAPGRDELVDAWQASVEAFAAWGHRYEEARSRARLATVLRAVGRPADAAPHLAAARALASSLGAAPLLADLDAARTSAPPGPAGHRAAPAAGEALTAREREVLELVAAGRSNRQIADQLFISAKTVSVHVSNLLAKLGAARRTEAVALARRRGLLGPEGRGVAGPPAASSRP